MHEEKTGRLLKKKNGLLFVNIYLHLHGFYLIFGIGHKLAQRLTVDDI